MREMKKRLLKKKIPYDEISGFYVLTKTNNKYLFAYLYDLDVTIKSRKIDDIILKIWKGKKWQAAKQYN